MTPNDIPIPDGPAGLLVCRDLIFISKVTGTASALGHKVIVAGNVALTSAMLEKWAPKVVLIDLASGDLAAPSNIANYRSIAPEGTPFLAFGSHVDTQALADAESAGCDQVMPRSKFSNELPRLLAHYFG